MKRCSGCGKSYRKGIMVYAASAKEGLARKRVCLDCYGSAVPLLVRGIEASRCKCGEVATSCIGCARKTERRDTADVIRAAVKKLSGYADVYDKEIEDEIAEGIRIAIRILEAGDF